MSSKLALVTGITGGRLNLHAPWPEAAWGIVSYSFDGGFSLEEDCYALGLGK
jgi:hypothetical protein